MGRRSWMRSMGAVTAALGMVALFPQTAHAQTVTGPSLAAFTQGADDSHFSANTVALNPSGTYLGPLGATVDGTGTTHVFASGANQHLFEFHQTGANWSPPVDLTAAVTGAPLVASAPTAFFDGTHLDVFALTTPNATTAQVDLIMYQNSGTAGAWTAIDINALAPFGSFHVIARVDPHFIGGILHVYGQTNGNRLVEIDNDNVAGHAWNIYDETASAGGGGNIFGGPSAVLIAGIPHVYARAAKGGHLVEYVADHLLGHVWNAYDTSSQVPGAPIITGNPHPVLINNVPHVYTQGAANGDLVEFVADHLNGSIWNVYDQTASNGAPLPVGNVSVVLTSGAPYSISQPVPEVWETPATGHLTTLVADHKLGHIWNVYDVSTISAGPLVTGDPTPIAKTGTTVQVFALGQ